MSRELSSVKFPQNRNGVRFATRFLVGTQMRFPLHLRSTRKLTLNEAQIVTIVGEHFGILAMRPKIKATAESTCRAMLFGKFIRDEDRRAMRYWETIADNLNKAGWSLAYVSAVNRQGRTIWIVDAHRDGKHRVMRAEEKLMLNSNLVQGNPAQPIAIVEVPFGIGISLKEFGKGLRPLRGDS